MKRALITIATVGVLAPTAVGASEGSHSGAETVRSSSRRALPGISSSLL
jgi:hypothetical protein